MESEPSIWEINTCVCLFMCNLMLCQLAVLEFDYYYLRALWSFILAYKDEDPAEYDQKIFLLRNFSIVIVIIGCIAAMACVCLTESMLWIYSLTIIPNIVAIVFLGYTICIFRKVIKKLERA